jgi:hypothetical protein
MYIPAAVGPELKEVTCWREDVRARAWVRRRGVRKCILRFEEDGFWWKEVS